MRRVDDADLAAIKKAEGYRLTLILIKMTTWKEGETSERHAEKKIILSYDESEELRRLVKLGIDTRSKLYTASSEEEQLYARLLEKL